MAVLHVFSSPQDQWTSMPNYCILIRAHHRGLGSQKNVPWKVLSSRRLLLNKRPSRLKLPFYNRFPSKQQCWESKGKAQANLVKVLWFNEAHSIYILRSGKV